MAHKLAGCYPTMSPRAQLNVARKLLVARVGLPPVIRKQTLASLRAPARPAHALNKQAEDVQRAAREAVASTPDAKPEIAHEDAQGAKQGQTEPPGSNAKDIENGWQPLTVDGKPVEFWWFSPDETNTDATKLQYQAGGESCGVTGFLQGVSQWCPVASGTIFVLEQADGTLVARDRGRPLAP